MGLLNCSSETQTAGLSLSMAEGKMMPSVSAVKLLSVSQRCILPLCFSVWKKCTNPVCSFQRSGMLGTASTHLNRHEPFLMLKASK